VDYAWVVHVYDLLVAIAGRVGESANPNPRCRASSHNLVPASFGMSWFP